MLSPIASRDVADFYDGYLDCLVSDYYDGNPRVEAALEFARESLSGCHHILDVGCGIGWTSAEMAATGAHVVGIDISPTLILTARQMFGERCSFIKADFGTVSIDGVFDGVLMVDVYEHFPRAARPQVHAQIRQALGDRLVVTVPTPEALQYARENGITLQIIDEDVTDADIDELAADVNGVVEVNRIVSIYRPDDYRHVLIRRC